MPNLHGDNGVDDDKSAGVQADNNEKDPSSSLSSSSPSADAFISAETMMDAEEMIDPQEAWEDALIQIHPSRSVIAHNDDDDEDKSAVELLLSPQKNSQKI